MADMIVPLTPAEMLVQQQAIDRQRKIAEYLQQQSLTPEQGQMVSGHYVAPSATQYIAKLAQGLIGKNQQESLDQKQKDIVTQQGDLQRVLYGIGKNPQAAQQTQAATQSPVSQALDAGAKAGSIGPTNDNLSRLAQALQNPQAVSPQPAAATTPTAAAQPSSLYGSRVIQGMDPLTAFSMATDPKTEAAYASAFLKQYEPTEAMRNNKALGISNDEAAAFERAARTKAGLMEGQPGNTVFNPVTGKPVFVAPDFKTGINGGFDANGKPIMSRIAGSEILPQIAGETKRAEAGAQADYDMVTVNSANGPVMVTRAQAAELARGGRSASAPAGTGGPQGLDLSKLTPEQQAYLAKADPQAFANGVADFQKTGMQQPAQQGAQPSGQGIPLQDESATKASTVIGEGLGKRYNDIQDAGFAANQKITKAAQLGGLLENLGTGKLAPAGYEIAAYAKSLGFPVSEKLDNAQAARSVASNIALELRNPSGGAGMPGAMSDSDRNYLTNMVAGLDKTPGANKMLIEAMQKLAQRDADVAQLAREYKQRTGKFDDGFYDELRKYSESHPLFQSSTKTGPKASPIDDLLKKYGGQ